MANERPFPVGERGGGGELGVATRLIQSSGLRGVVPVPAARRFLIHGGRPLSGEVAVAGAKNSALPVIAAACLAREGETVLENVPHNSDILDLCAILEDLGARTDWLSCDVLKISAGHLEHTVAPYTLARKFRGSIYVVGLLLARLGAAEVAMPGGCDIGSRPVDFHLKGFQAMGAEARVEHGAIHAQCGRLKGAKIFVDRSSVGTTINVMIAAALADGTTQLDNAAQEPEVVDLANFLTALGVKVRGAGTKTIRVEGCRTLRGAHHEIIPDRLEAGTFLLAAAVAGGEVRVTSVIPEHLRTVLTKLEAAGCELEEGPDWVRLVAPPRLKAVDVQTATHPGFPTDLQSPFVAAMSVANGVSVIQETVFESRFGYVNELARLGASIKVDRDVAVIQGVERLTGAPLEASDIRGGVALVLAALKAEGTTEVLATAIGRGYQDLDAKLRDLGADIQAVE